MHQATPSVPRRMAVMLYEGLVLFGVTMAAGYLYSPLTQQRHALQGMHGLQAFLFLVLGIYFVWFWTHGGQTVAMKAWQVRVVDSHGRPLGQGRALLRYLASWLWFLPGLVAASMAPVHQPAVTCGALLVWMLVYAASSRLQRDRQFWHDVLCKTRLVRVQAPAAGGHNARP